MSVFGLDPQAKDRTIETEIWRLTAPVGLTRFFLKLRIKYLLMYFASIAAFMFALAAVIEFWRFFACAAVVIAAFWLQWWLVKTYLKRE